MIKDPVTQGEIDDLLDLVDGLDDWEMDFLDSINNQTYPLTSKQRYKLEQMWDNHC